VKDDESILILAVNATSLARYHKDTQDDPNMRQADLVFMFETRIGGSHDLRNVVIPSHHAAKLVPAEQAGNGSKVNGAMLQLKSSSFPENGPCVIQQRTGGSEILCYTLVLPGGDLFCTVIGVYRSPRASVSALLEALRDHLTTGPCIVLGDLNIDMLVPENAQTKRLSMFMARYNMRQLIAYSTHRAGALLDHVWVPGGLEARTSSGTLPNYFTDHDAVWLNICKLPLG